MPKIVPADTFPQIMHYIHCYIFCWVCWADRAKCTHFAYQNYCSPNPSYNYLPYAKNSHVLAPYSNVLLSHRQNLQ